jgi:hypothetical protein
MISIRVQVVVTQPELLKRFLRGIARSGGVHCLAILALVGAQKLQELRPPRKLPEFVEVVLPPKLQPQASPVAESSGIDAGSGIGALLKTARLSPAASLPSHAEARPALDGIARELDKRARSERLAESGRAGDAARALQGGHFSAQGVQWEASGAGKGGKPLDPTDLEKIRKQLSQRASEFRDCYERALLRDDSLEGTADFSFVVGSGGGLDAARVDFSGKGGNPVIGNLKGCLSEVSRRIHFPGSVAGNTLRYTLKFKS